MQYIISFLDGVTAFLSPGLLVLLLVYAVWCLGGGLRSNQQSLRAGFSFCLGFGAAFLAAAARLQMPEPLWGSILLGLGLLRITALEAGLPKPLPGFLCGMAVAQCWTGRHGFFPDALTAEGWLLLVCSVFGTVVPFLFGGVFLDRLKTELPLIRNHLRETALISGVLLLAAGIIIML